MATGAGEQLSKADRQRMFSTTRAVIEDDPLDVRARLQLVDLLQQDGDTEQAVVELLHTAAIYTERGVPIKAVAVLRQAVKVAPQRPDVRVNYGEVFEKLRMLDDAVREYRAACDLYHAAGQYGLEVEVLARLVAIDEGNFGAQLAVGEALHRIGHSGRAAALFRQLGEQLLAAGETRDWELVAERAVFLDPNDVTTAHDLALHYVRSRRHAEALSKLIRCFEAEPNDVELLELIVETLEHLGQRQRAATLLRQLIARYRIAGLTAEADKALARLFSLDPDDEEARSAMGVLQGAIDGDSVIELHADGELPTMEGISDSDDEIGFGGDFIDQLLSASSGATGPPVLRPSGAFEPILTPDPKPIAHAPIDATIDDDMPPLPTPIGAPPLPVVTAARPSANPVVRPSANPVVRPSANPVVQPPAIPVAQPPTVRAVRPPAMPPLPEVAQPDPPQRSISQGFGQGGSRPLPPPPTRPGKPIARPRFADGGGTPGPIGAVPPLDSPRMPASPSAGFSVGDPPDLTMPLIPTPARKVGPRSTSTPAGASTRPPSVSRTLPRAGAQTVQAKRPTTTKAPAVVAPKPVRSTNPARHADTDQTTEPPPAPAPVAVPKAGPSAPTSTENISIFLLEEDEEHGFSGESEMTSIDPAVFAELDRLAAARRRAPVAAPTAAPTAPESPVPTRPDAATRPAGEKLAGAAGSRTLTPMRRSTKLPRPRLTRHRRSHNEATDRRGIETDLKTLDFFIERGFYESAAALVAELEKRYPHSEELRVRRGRIAQMK